jgi:CTP synthase
MAFRGLPLLTHIKVACRCEQPLAESTVAKLALHCQVELDQILVVRDMPTVYQVPLLLEEQKIIPLLRTRLNLDALSLAPASVSTGAELWDTWKFVVTQEHEATINIALVGKYVESHDAYLSVVKSLEHSSMHLRRKLNLIWVDAEHLEPKTMSMDEEKYNEAWNAVRTASGVIVPGGFGTRGTEGMMLASKFARENGTPFLGVRCPKTHPIAHT